MGSRQAMHVRVGILAALVVAGLFAAAALTGLTSEGAPSQWPAITSAATTRGTTTTTGSVTPPKRVWMSFEVSPVSIVLRPLRKFAACVRRHGITGLSDPKVVGGKVVLMLPRGLTAKSLRLKAAERACQKLLPRGANTQSGTRTGPTTTRPGG